MYVTAALYSLRSPYHLVPPLWPGAFLLLFVLPLHALLSPGSAGLSPVQAEPADVALPRPSKAVGCGPLSWLRASPNAVGIYPRHDPCP
ncbi:hypothetical protein M8818_004013 [Zalaria obscura]|uniref:Uncharacterized protein n=1 Tax=Zalaria obscura TaxID=2024903 RepID=A0ACC3SD39_9PEZI